MQFALRARNKTVCMEESCDEFPFGMFTVGIGFRPDRGQGHPVFRTGAALVGFVSVITNVSESSVATNE